MAEQITLDPRGALILKLDYIAPHRIARIPRETHRLRVSSVVMSFMSETFERMLNGNFAEGQPTGRPGPREIPLPEDDALGMTWLCQALHNGPNWPSPTSRLATVETMLEMLWLADKYLAMERVAGRAQAWLNDAFEVWKRECTSRYGDKRAPAEAGFVLLAALCYLGEHKDSDHAAPRRLFERTAEALITFLDTGDIRTEKFARLPYSRILPGSAVVQILEKHTAVINNTRLQLGTALTEYRCRWGWKQVKDLPFQYRCPSGLECGYLMEALRHLERSGSVLAFRSRIDALAHNMAAPDYRLGKHPYLMRDLFQSLRGVKNEIFVAPVRWCHIVEDGHGM